MPSNSLSLLFDVSGIEPPAGIPEPLQALWWLRKGNFRMGPEWERAHALCQQDEGNSAHDIVHGLAHWIEGDIANAAYWYRRVPGERSATVEKEWERIAVQLSAEA